MHHATLRMITQQQCARLCRHSCLQGRRVDLKIRDGVAAVQCCLTTHGPRARRQMVTSRCSKVNKDPSESCTSCAGTSAAEPAATASTPRARHSITGVQNCLHADQATERQNGLAAGKALYSHSLLER